MRNLCLYNSYFFGGFITGKKENPMMTNVNCKPHYLSLIITSESREADFVFPSTGGINFTIENRK